MSFIQKNKKVWVGALIVLAAIVLIWNFSRNNQSNTETEEEYEEPDYEEEVEENYSSNETAMNEESSYSGKSETNKVVETMPTFPGGNEALMKYLSDNVKVPLYAEENGIQGLSFGWWVP